MSIKPDETILKLQEKQKRSKNPYIKLRIALRNYRAYRILEATMSGSLPALLLFLGLTCVLLGNLSGDVGFWSRLASAVGSALLAGGVFSVILKSMLFDGVYHEVLNDILFDEKYLKNRNDLPDLWSKVTSLLSKERFSELNVEMHKTVMRNYIPTETDFYYERYNRTCVVNWHNKETSDIILMEELELDIVPSNHESTIIYTFSSSPSPGVPLRLNCTEIIQLKINDKTYVKDGEVLLPDEVKIRKEDNHDGVQYTVEVYLSGSKKYVVTKSSQRIFPMLIDPYQAYTSTRFIKGAKINVHCVAEDLRVRFVALGTPEDFDSFAPKTPEIAHKDRAGDINREYPGLLFPQQGYLLVFHHLDPAVLNKYEITPGSINIAENQ